MKVEAHVTSKVVQIEADPVRVRSLEVTGASIFQSASITAISLTYNAQPPHILTSLLNTLS